MIRKVTDKPTRHTGPLPNRIEFQGDAGDGSWKDVVFAVINSDAFELKSLYVKEDFGWDSGPGLYYKSKDDVNAHRAEIEAFEPVDNVSILGSVGGEDIKISTVPTFDNAKWMLIDYADGCPVDDFVKSLDL